MRRLLLIVFPILLISCHHNEDELSLKLVPAKQGDYWGYLDHDGKFAINPQFKTAYTFHEGMAIVAGSDDKYGFIDESGKLIIMPQYKTVNFFNEGLAPVVKENERITYIDKTGKIVLTLDETIESAEPFSEDLAVVKINGKYGFINKDGKVVINAQYDYAQRFNEGLALVEQKNKTTDKSMYGYIDKDGKLVIPFQFESSYGFGEGKAVIKQGDKYGYINKDGKIIINAQYDDAGNFEEGLAPVKQGDLYGFIDQDGKIAINPQFKNAYSFTSSGLCIVQSVTNNKWGAIDRQGKMVIDPQYDYMIGFFDGVAMIELNDKYGLIDKAGKTVANPMYESMTVAPEDYFASVENDYFDISSISNILYKDLADRSARGITAMMNFSDLQRKFPGLTHDNYSNYTSFESEGNNSLNLTSMKFELDDNFITLAADSLNYFQSVYIYHDNAVLKSVAYTFDLKKQALAKSSEILKQLENKKPNGFTQEMIGNTALLLYGQQYSIAVATENDKLYMRVFFDQNEFNKTKQDLSGINTNPPSTTDSPQRSY